MSHPSLLALLPDTAFDDIDVWVQEQPSLYRFPREATADAEGLWSPTHRRIMLSRKADDVRRTLATREVWNAEWAARHDEPPTPPWMSEEDLQLYVDEFTRTGFTGGLNWYRNLDRSWAYLEPFEGRTIDQPALFITGSRDPVRAFMPHEAMIGSVTDLRDVIVIEGAGHWVQQEQPDEVNEALLDFLDKIEATPTQ